MYKATINITVEVESETPFTTEEFQNAIEYDLYYIGDSLDDLSIESMGVSVSPLEWFEVKTFEVGEVIKAAELKDLPAGFMVRGLGPVYVAISIPGDKLRFVHSNGDESKISFAQAIEYGREYEILYLPEEQ